jgi:uncharacterized protein
MRAYLISALFLCSIFLQVPTAVAQQQQISRPGKYEGYSKPQNQGYTLSSVYVKMDDGVRIATDIYLPKNLKGGERVPTIFYQTRYGRRMEVRNFFKPLMKNFTMTIRPEEIKKFTEYGYAVVAIDVRGSGASFGTRPIEFGDRELADGKLMLDWISQQSWSNGRIGATGNSYLGTTALMLLATHHPALQAVVPRSAIVDLYEDVSFPGGMCNTRFLSGWNESCQALDRNDISEIHPAAGKVLKGMSRVDDDLTGQLLNEAVKEHCNNVNIVESARIVRGRDTHHPIFGNSMDDASAHRLLKELKTSTVPVYWIGGWQDGAFIRSTLRGYQLMHDNSRVLIGPWGHAQRVNISPAAVTYNPKMDLPTELLRFFDRYLKDVPNGIDNEPHVRYYVQGEERFHSSPVWPPATAANQTLFLSDDHGLRLEKPSVSSSPDVYTVDTTLYNKRYTRWDIFSHLVPGRFTPLNNIQGESRKLMNYTTLPVSSPVKITGSPVVELEIASDTTDAAIFVYLEDVDPEGSVSLITEGLFRAAHRKVETTTETCLDGTPCHSFLERDLQPLVPHQPAKVAFALMPIAYELELGHSLRVSIGGAQTRQFANLAANTKHLTIFKGNSSLTIPVIGTFAPLQADASDTY